MKSHLRSKVADSNNLGSLTFECWNACLNFFSKTCSSFFFLNGQKTQTLFDQQKTKLNLHQFNFLFYGSVGPKYWTGGRKKKRKRIFSQSKKIHIFKMYLSIICVTNLKWPVVTWSAELNKTIKNLHNLNMHLHYFRLCVQLYCNHIHCHK